ncbi:MAG: VanZ family protein [Bacteroidaceae bacterium]|jgi:VanZ family protein|nr:VanZ family protein [Bacteroidaceae bacterium]MBR0047293.1 VanZ family protein [Bacteroidaceae bacterium]
MKLKEYLFTTLVTAFIVTLSTIPIPEHPPLGDVPLMDKWVHMVMYGGLVFVMWIDHVVRNKRTFSWKARGIMLLYSIALGGVMELVQAYLTTCRSGEWLDFEADAIGAAVSVLLCIYLNKLWNEKISVRK